MDNERILLEKERGLNATAAGLNQRLKTTDSIKKIIEVNLTPTGKEKLEVIQKTMTTIGNYYLGGIIINKTGEHGVIVAESDQNDGSKTDWDNAKKLCENFKSDSVGGWRLPTINELKMIYNLRNKIGGLNTSDLYWSSSDAGDNRVFLINFSNGITSYNYNKEKNMGHTYYVRAVRDF